MKKILALILAACLMLCAAYALAATGNVTIAVQGQDGFNDFISGMQVWGDKLLLSSYNSLYAWNSETRKLVEVQGYDQLQYMLTDEETGVIKAEEDEYCYFDSDLYVADGKLYRMAQINDSDGNQTSYLVEIIISDDGELSLGDVIDLGDALSITNEADGETYSYTRGLQNPCSFGRTIYAPSSVAYSYSGCGTDCSAARKMMRQKPRFFQRNISTTGRRNAPLDSHMTRSAPIAASARFTGPP